MPVQRSCPVLAMSIASAVGLVIFLFFFAHLGGLLNRSRGGYVNLRNPANNSVNLDYWSAEVVKNLLFAVPTGIIVLLFGLHFRASTVVFLMTWFSLYIGWGSYMNIGSVAGNYKSRSGAFDWLVGRQEEGWHYNRRFLREFSGMSLRGLAWTGPQGYALQQLGFGWEYSLSGSLMGFVYFLGSKTPTGDSDDHFDKTFGAHTAFAEYYWGIWIWFVLTVVCLSQVVRRMHIWIFSKKEYLGFKPFSSWEKMKYESLNRSLSRGIYEGVMLLFNFVLMCSVIYYSLVQQKDVKNKGQTFFGLFTGILLLTFLQGWNYNMLYQKLKSRRSRNKMVRTPASVQGASRAYASPRVSPRIPDLDHLETAAATANGENKPLLGWYARSSPSPENRRSTLSLPEESSPNPHRSHLQLGTIEPATTTTAFLILWPAIEKWVWVDVFIWVRRIIGLVSIIATLNTIIVSVAALFADWDTPRYLHPNCTYTYGDV